APNSVPALALPRTIGRTWGWEMLTIRSSIRLERLSCISRCEYCGRFLPCLQLFVPHFAFQCSSLCGIVYHYRKKGMNWSTRFHSCLNTYKNHLINCVLFHSFNSKLLPH